MSVSGEYEGVTGCSAATKVPPAIQAESSDHEAERAHLESNLLPGLQVYLKEWPETSNKSPTGHCCTHFWGASRRKHKGVQQSFLDRTRESKRRLLISTLGAAEKDDLQRGVPQI